MIFTRNKKIFSISFLLLILIVIASGIYYFNQNKKVKKTISIDLKQIKKRGKLIAITEFNSTSFFIYKGATMGFQYELLQQFAKHLELELKVVLCNNLYQTFDSLALGKGDLIALNLNATPERLTTMNFTLPFSKTNQILIQRKPDKWQEMSKKELNKNLVRHLKELNYKKVYIQINSSFRQTLKHLSDSLKINIFIRDTAKTTEELISLVADKKISFAVCDENVGYMIQRSFPSIDIKTPVSFEEGLSWAVRKNSTHLLDDLNKWLKEYIKTSEYAFIYNKYYTTPDWVAQRRKTGYFSVNSNRISAYDETIKKYSKLIDWDWKLIASLMYEESRFNNDLISSHGAIGLMQLDPKIAKKYKLDSLSSPANNIRSGIKHLKEINDIFKKDIKNKDERIKFILAAYNTGIINIMHARDRAKKNHVNPNVWDEGVAYFIFKDHNLKEMTDSTKDHVLKNYTFVRNILERFEHYKTTIKENDDSKLKPKK